MFKGRQARSYQCIRVMTHTQSSKEKRLKTARDSFLWLTSELGPFEALMFLYNVEVSVSL